MKKLLSCAFNMDTGCVELRYADGSMYSIDCTAVENEVARNMYERSELDYLVYNDPVGYADLVFNGDLKAYLRNVTDYRPLATDILGLLSSGDLIAVAVFVVFEFPLPLPFYKLPLAFLAFIIGENVQENAARVLLDLMLRDAGVVDELLSPTQDSPPSYAVG